MQRDWRLGTSSRAFVRTDDRKVQCITRLCARNIKHILKGIIYNIIESLFGGDVHMQIVILSNSRLHRLYLHTLCTINASF